MDDPRNGRRYHQFAQVGARNIQDYNPHESRGQKRLPYLVIVIDELADLMLLAPDETERTITRLAQLARATGIHLVLATQRPSVDVVTGLIKANFPARIAFAVASNTDSRVILDQPGAERLLGRGDMLYQAPDAPAPVRLQGVFVSDREIQPGGILARPVGRRKSVWGAVHAFGHASIGRAAQTDRHVRG
jgi:DNA segregation ATPase FtsK/SpoIIIE, S-DNA-T family